MRLLLILAIILLSCAKNSESIVTEEYLVHPNGLRVIYPVGFKEVLTDTGFLLEEVGDLRRPRRIVIDLSSKQVVVNGNLRQLNNEDIYYVIERLGAGSGGDEYQLTGSKAVGNHWIVFSSYAQMEGEAPSFDLTWELIKHSELK